MGKTANRGMTRKPTREEDRAKVAKEILQSIKEKLEGTTAKATVGDYIKLIQLEKEMIGEVPREIKMTWIDPPDMDPSSEA